MFTFRWVFAWILIGCAILMGLCEAYEVVSPFLLITKLFDGEFYKLKGKEKERLSQKNLSLKYVDYLTDKLKSLRDKTKDLYEKIDIELYKDTTVAHSDKEIMTGKSTIMKHNIEKETIISLVDKSIESVLDIKAKINKLKTIVSTRLRINTLKVRFDHFLKHGNFAWF